MKLKLGIIPLLSVLHDASKAEASHSDIILELKEEYDVSFIGPEGTGNVDLPIVFIYSGGTENQFKSIYDSLPKPVMLLTDGRHNSLAASMEILAWIRERGDDSVILHGSINNIMSQINIHNSVSVTAKKLKGAAIGVLGFPSDWLIASGVDYIEAQAKWGVIYRNIELCELSRRMEGIGNCDAEKIAEHFIDRAASIKEPDKKDIIEGAKVYLALRDLCRDHGLDAVTVRCFELLSMHNVTGCLALSFLNDENIISGCEGDCQAVFSMLLLNYITGNKCFMANPSRIDTKNNDIILAHCTIPTCMTDKYIVRNHFESGIGVGIQGVMKKGPVTIFKCGGSKLSKYYLELGEIAENLEDDNMCRTQVKVHLKGDTDYFLRDPIGNHHIMIEGDHTKTIETFMKYMDCRRIF